MYNSIFMTKRQSFQNLSEVVTAINELNDTNVVFNQHSKVDYFVFHIKNLTI